MVYLASKIFLECVCRELSIRTSTNEIKVAYFANDDLLKALQCSCQQNGQGKTSIIPEIDVCCLKVRPSVLCTQTIFIHNSLVSRRVKLKTQFMDNV